MTKLLFNSENPLSCYSNFLCLLISCLGLVITGVKIFMAELHPGWFFDSGHPVFSRPASGALTLLIAGLIFYGAAVTIRTIKKPNIRRTSGFREFFKLFILAGLSCHYMMIVIYFI